MAESNDLSKYDCLADKEGLGELVAMLKDPEAMWGWCGETMEEFDADHNCSLDNNEFWKFM